MIVGDNGNIYRLVGAPTGAVPDVQLRQVHDGVTLPRPRLDHPARGHAARLHAGRPATLHDVHAGRRAGTTSAAPTRSTASPATTSIYGRRGNDVLFGDGQDDDSIGGWGNDWISGGTGDDGILGDDGRIFTSRNGTGRAALRPRRRRPQLVDRHAGQRHLGDASSRPGQLNKTVDLTPFNLDHERRPARTRSSTGGADDVIYGGLGNDFLHGGAGDDAISGAEALRALLRPAVDPRRRRSRVRAS